MQQGAEEGDHPSQGERHPSGERRGGADRRPAFSEQPQAEIAEGAGAPVQQGAEEGDHPSQGERHPSGERRGGADRRPAFSEQPQAEIAEGAGASETLHGRSCFPAAAFAEQPAHPGIGFAGVHGGQGEPVLHAGEADQGRGEVSDLQAEDDEGREREGDRACEEGGRKDHEGGETLHGRSCFPAAAFAEQPAHPGIGFAGVHGGQGEPVLHAGEADQGRGEVSDLQAEDDEGREREGDRACEEGGRKDHEGGEGAEEVPDRRASAAFERSEGGDEPDRTKTGAGVLLPAVRQDDAGVPVPSEREGRAERVCPGMGEVQYEAEGEADDGSDVHPGLFVRQDDAGVPVPSEREGRAERVCPGMGEVQYEAEGEADDGSDVHPGLFVSVGHQADAGNGQGGVRS